MGYVYLMLIAVLLMTAIPRPDNKLTAEELNALPIEDAITEVHGHPARTIYLITQPDCWYCQDLKERLAEVEDVAIHEFIVDGKSKETREKARAMWCKNEDPCNTSALVRNRDFAKSHKLTNTPTIITEDGVILMGNKARKYVSKLQETNPS